MEVKTHDQVLTDSFRKNEKVVQEKKRVANPSKKVMDELKAHLDKAPVLSFEDPFMAKVSAKARSS